MKKQISFGLGVAVLAAAAIPFADASREAYHSYLMSQKSRTYSEGSFPNPSYIGQRWYASQDLAVRPSTFSLRARNGYARKCNSNCSWKKDIKNVSRSAIAYAEDAIKQFYTFENNTFSIELPAGWSERTPGSHEFVGHSNYKVSVEKFNKDACTTSQGFTACSINLSRNMNQSENGRIIPQGKVVRQSQFADTVLNTQLQTKTYTESFTATAPQGEQIYINRYFIADLDGGIYVVETQSDIRSAGGYVGVSKRVFDSFRIYPSNYAPQQTAPSVSPVQLNGLYNIQPANTGGYQINRY
jgi:hypothetical protein